VKALGPLRPVWCLGVACLAVEVATPTKGTPKALQEKS